MPTAYTAPIETGEITTLEQFAMRCARNFGALIAMRDAPLSTPIPERFEPDTKYYDEQLAAAKKRLVELCAMSADQVAAECAAEHEIAMAAATARIAEQRSIRARYAAMKRHVQAWGPGLKYFDLKLFMCSQIEICEKHIYEPDLPKPQAPVVWFNQAIEKCRKDIEYHSTERDKEIKRTEDRNAWLAGLRDALKPTAPETDKDAA